MRPENKMRLLLFLGVAALHIAAVLFVAVDTRASSQPVRASDAPQTMRLTDYAEIIPEAPAIAAPPLPQTAPQEDSRAVESIAETVIETDIAPDENVVAPGSLTTPSSGAASGSGAWDGFLQAHQVTNPPRFDESAIAADLVRMYPPIALRSSIEGRVILELFVDNTGIVQLVRILQENPEGWGFAAAAEKAFMGRQGTPANAEGVAVSARFRYPVSFRIK